MNISQIKHVVVMAVDTRYPDYADRTRLLLTRAGFSYPSVYINGRGSDRISSAMYSKIHTGLAPPDWRHSQSAYDYAIAYREVIAFALNYYIEPVLIVEDDIDLSLDFKAIISRVQLPDDWQMLYFGAMHYWANTPAPLVGPYLRRLNGGQLGTQAVLWRRFAMEQFLKLDLDDVVDQMICRLHDKLPCYAIDPAIIRQATGVRSVISPDESPFDSPFIYDVRQG